MLLVVIYRSDEIICGSSYSSWTYLLIIKSASVSIWSAKHTKLKRGSSLPPFFLLFWCVKLIISYLLFLFSPIVTEHTHIKGQFHVFFCYWLTVLFASLVFIQHVALHQKHNLLIMSLTKGFSWSFSQKINHLGVEPVWPLIKLC